MRFETLPDWLAYQQTLNPQTIDLGLARVKRVYDRLGSPKIAHTVITVAGTNGKGSTVAAYEHWLQQQGSRVASYTSPHLLRYNERVRLNGQAVSDQLLVQAFDAIEQARGEDALTYFEFGTLAAFLIMSEYLPDYAILEVGLGGRLDAVNILHADLAHITMIGLDHQAWLGDTREQIAIEKAGILRAGKLAVCNDPEPPATLIECLQSSGSQFVCLGQDYSYRLQASGELVWQSNGRELTLAMPEQWRQQAFQARNLSGVLAGLQQLGCLQEMSEQTIAQGFQGITLEGRMQAVMSPLAARLVIDVGHNVDAARVIGAEVHRLPVAGRRVLLLGMLSDKDCGAFYSALCAEFDECWLIGLDCERGQTAEQLRARLDEQSANLRNFNSADDALQEALSSLTDQDILVATGSFMTVEAVLNSSTRLQTK